MARITADLPLSDSPQITFTPLSNSRTVFLCDWKFFISIFLPTFIFSVLFAILDPIIFGYEGRILKLGINANTGKAIRQSFSGKSEEIVLEKLRNQFIKNKEEGIKETVYTESQISIIKDTNTQ